MYNIDENNLVYERDEIEVNEWRCVLNDSAGNTLCDMIAEINADSTINYTASYNKMLSFMSEQTLFEKIVIASETPGFSSPAAKVWVGGEMQRCDYLVGEDSAQPLVDILEQRFPAYQIHQSEVNVIGSYGPYREGYTAESSISWYDNFPSAPWGYPPSRPPLLKYNIDYANVYTHIQFWTGYKFNLSDNTIQVKVVHHNPLPTVTYPPFVDGQINTYYARLHNEDGTVENFNDMFFMAEADDVESYCTEHNISSPLTNTGVDPLSIMIYGLVFDGTTGIPNMMKAYESRNVLPT